MVVGIKIERNEYTVSNINLTHGNLYFPSRWRMKVYYDGYTIITSDTIGYDEFMGSDGEYVMDQFLDYVGGRIYETVDAKAGI